MLTDIHSQSACASQLLTLSPLVFNVIWITWTLEQPPLLWFRNWLFDEMTVLSAAKQERHSEVLYDLITKLPLKKLFIVPTVKMWKYSSITDGDRGIKNLTLVWEKTDLSGSCSWASPEKLLLCRCDEPDCNMLWAVNDRLSPEV